MTELREEEEKDEHSDRASSPSQLIEVLCIQSVLAQFYLMQEGQLILLAESTEILAPGNQPRQFHLVPEGQLILLTESTENLVPGYQPRQFILMQEGTTERADSASRPS